MDEKKLLKDSAVHNIIIESREQISISGVENVVSFDEDKIVVETIGETLTLEGEMSVEGYIYSVIYNDSKNNSSGGGILARLFR